MFHSIISLEDIFYPDGPPINYWDLYQQYPIYDHSYYSNFPNNKQISDRDNQ
jgi:hypothetical protein